MSTWTFVCDSFDPENEDLRQALCTPGNGYFTLRGAAAESDADEVHYYEPHGHMGVEPCAGTVKQLPGKFLPV